MEEDDNNDASYKWINEFEDFCSSDDLSLNEIRKMINNASKDDLDNSLMCLQDAEYKQHKHPIQPLKLQSLHKSNFLHRVCMNENVTLEIVTYLLDVHPSAAHRCLDILNLRINEGGNIYILCFESVYPMHLACYNKECPNEVIQLILQKECRNQLTHVGYMDFNWGKTGLDGGYYGGTPLHYYLSRTSNVDLDVVKQLVANPEMLLLTGDDTNCTPMHILMHNKNIGEMSDVVKYLVESNPDSLKAKDEYDRTPLNVACMYGFMTAKTIELLLEACPESIHQRSSSNALPIHKFCEVKDMDDAVAIDILKLLLEAHPDLVSQTSSYGEHLPLHLAASNKSQSFCKILVDAYPESVKVDGYGCLPFHCACNNGRLDTVKYLFGLYPECLHIRNDDGYLPIHEAASDPGKNTAEIVNFLLLQDPDCLSKPVVSNFASYDDGYLPLHLACSSRDESNVIEHLFDLYPEAILIQNEQEQLPIDILREKLDELHINSETGRPYPHNEEWYQRLQYLIRFLQTQMSYARKAQDETAMRTFDFVGYFPLHRAIRDKAPLGAIKLLLKGNPNAIDVPMVLSEMYPLDIACQFSTLDIVKYLVELSPDRLNPCGFSRNFPLHHACRGGNCEVIQYLLDRPMSSASVSERNVDGMLSIHLFCEFVNEQEEEEDDAEDTTEYTETIWRLLIAYPETVLNW